MIKIHKIVIFSSLESVHVKILVMELCETNSRKITPKSYYSNKLAINMRILLKIWNHENLKILSPRSGQTRYRESKTTVLRTMYLDQCDVNFNEMKNPLRKTREENKHWRIRYINALLEFYVSWSVIPIGRRRLQLPVLCVSRVYTHLRNV